MDKLREMINALGTLAEMALVFYRSAIQAHATPDEAKTLTTAYMEALMRTGQKQDQPENDG